MFGPDVFFLPFLWPSLSLPSSYLLLYPFMFLHLTAFLTIAAYLTSKYKLPVLFLTPNVLGIKNTR